jgi:hypothetical protein
MKQLYVVRISRVVLAENPSNAEAIALAASNPDDVDAIEVVTGLYDIPVEWHKAVPYGSDTLDTLHCLAAQLAAENLYDVFEYHPCLKVGEDDAGNAILEQCAENEPSISTWSVYGHLVTICLANRGLECVADFVNRDQAVGFWNLINQAAMFQAIQEQAEDAHLEAAYEDRVTGGDYDTGD